MKSCERCGAKNANASLFCQHCGAPLRAADPSLNGEVPLSEFTAPEREVLDAEPTVVETREIQPWKSPKSHDNSDQFYAATSEMIATVGAGLWSIIVAIAVWCFRLTRPIMRVVLRTFRNGVTRAFSPSSWEPTWSPNLVFWGAVGALLWRLPTSIIGIVYAVLANDARRRQDYQLARERAEHAVNWLLLDLCLGLIVLVFRKIVF
jgi:hypothetical protein